jgi:hypothetical protein
MILQKQIETLQLAHKLIAQMQTGTPQDFSRKLKISERRLYEIIDEMKAMGAPIDYSRISRTYYYAVDCEAQLECKFRCLSSNEEKNIVGGKIFFSKNLYCLFYAVSHTNFALSNG